MVSIFIGLGHTSPSNLESISDKAKDGDLCYKQMEWIDTWMNTPSIKKALGVNPQMDFQSCNMEVNQAFFGQGDGMHNSAALLPDLINDDIKLLVYAGNADMMCNFIVSTLISALQSKLHLPCIGA